MDTHDFGPDKKFYWHFGLFTTDGSIKRVPLLGRIPSQEIEPPFRRANAYFFRFPFSSFGLIFGKWEETDMDEEAAILLAMQGYGLDLYDEDLDDEDIRDTIRQNIAENIDDIDDEWTVLRALGMDK